MNVMFSMENVLVISILWILTGKVHCNNGLTCNFESNFCGWISDGWIRANKSEFKSTGPQQEGEGFYIRIGCISEGYISTLKAPFQQKSGTACLKFKYHMYGYILGELKYGYYTDNNNLTVKNKIGGINEDFWHCSKIDLTANVPESANGIFFQADCKDGNSLIALDDIVYVTGAACYDFSVDCPQPPTATTTTLSPSTIKFTDEPKSNHQPVIIGGSCVGILIVLLTITITVYVVRLRRKKMMSSQFIYSPQINRALPAIPKSENENDTGEIVLSIAESFDRKFSLKPTTAQFKSKNEPQQKRPESQDYTAIAETKSVQDMDVNNDTFGEYIHIPPDYSDDEGDNNNAASYNHVVENNFRICKLKGPCTHDYVNTTDDDYLRPTVRLVSQRAPDNQYESDPTEKKIDSLANLCLALSVPPTEKRIDSLAELSIAPPVPSTEKRTDSLAELCMAPPVPQNEKNDSLTDMFMVPTETESHMNIPEIPTMKRANIPCFTNKGFDIEGDYVDATASPDSNSVDLNSEESGKSDNSFEDYIEVKSNQSGDGDDYIIPLGDSTL